MRDIDWESAIRMDSVARWREWLAANGADTKSVILIIYHKASKTPSIHWHEAIEHALCYGWVDSVAKKRDDESCYLKFTPRGPKSTWGKKNIERANRLIAQGLMTEMGMRAIETAKKDRRWKEN